MSIEMIKAKCIGCGRCSEICPGSLIRLNQESKAVIVHPERCWGCASCLKECPVQAISLFLGEDMGGVGGRLSVKKEKNLLHWTVIKSDGSKKVLTVDSQNANQY